MICNCDIGISWDRIGWNMMGLYGIMGYIYTTTSQSCLDLSTLSPEVHWRSLKPTRLTSHWSVLLKTEDIKWVHQEMPLNVWSRLSLHEHQSPMIEKKHQFQSLALVDTGILWLLQSSPTVAVSPKFRRQQLTVDQGHSSNQKKHNVSKNLSVRRRWRRSARCMCKWAHHVTKLLDGQSPKTDTLGAGPGSSWGATLW